MLWENEFYEDGVEISNRIIRLCHLVDERFLANLAIEAREKQKLRHVPLLLTRELARRGSPLTKDTLFRVIQRADEITEFMAMYWKEGRCPISAQVKKGLALAFSKFDEYQLSKYDRKTAIKLRDVLFLCHAKPENEERTDLYKRLAEGKLRTPDTWEVNLSMGKDKRETFTRMLKENKLGAMAFLRNLRNMIEAEVDDGLIRKSFSNIRADRVLPFRFLAAVQHAPRFEQKLENLMLKCLSGKDKIPGKTILLVDVSGSMSWKISEKSKMIRMDAACGLAIFARELFADLTIYSFSNYIVEIAPRRGFALRDAINVSQSHSGTWLGGAIEHCMNKYDRIIVITDEQSHDAVPDPTGIYNYMINVASYKNGVGYGKWTHIDGWSEAVMDFIIDFEAMEGV
jgi:hypothetical protein